MSKRDIRDELLKDPDVARAYAELPLDAVIALTIAKRRRQLEMSQGQLATAAGLSQMQISRLESGHSNPTLSTLEKVGKALGVALVRPPIAPEQKREEEMIYSNFENFERGNEVKKVEIDATALKIEKAGEGTHVAGYINEIASR